MNYRLSDFEKDFDPNENYKDDEDELAFAHTLYSADAGNAEYMRVLGDIYSGSGYGVKQDYGKAIYWYTRAADCGDRCAQLRLAELLFTCADKGVPQDCRRAFELYTLASEGGSALALFRLGVMRRDGLGCTADRELARELLLRASEGGDRDACYEYALLLREEGAEEWRDYLKKSADCGCGRACTELLKNADALDDRQFYRCLMSAANDYSYGYSPVEAQLRLAECFMHGTRVKKNEEYAEGYYKRAAEGGSVRAKEALKKYFGIG